jgi:heme/copper-type cytochrome/quinol oxidase subunit 3
VTAASTASTASTPRPVALPRAIWGMWMLILTELMIFLSLIGSYFYVRAGEASWPPPGIEAPPLGRIVVFTFVLLGSSVPMWWAERAARAGRMGGVQAGLALAWAMGAVFFANQVVEFRHLGFGPRDTVYGSLFYAITGLHGAHLVVGLVMNGVAQVKAALGKFDGGRHLTVDVVSLYWHFVDAVWILVFSTVYLSPHLLR